MYDPKNFKLFISFWVNYLMYSKIFLVFLFIIYLQISLGYIRPRQSIFFLHLMNLNNYIINKLQNNPTINIKQTSKKCIKFIQLLTLYNQ